MENAPCQTAAAEKFMIVMTLTPPRKNFFFCFFLLLLCFSEFASYQSLKFESISVEAFTFGKDQYVVFPQPFAGTCSFLEWDHVEMTFRPFETIESEKKTKVTVLTL